MIEFTSASSSLLVLWSQAFTLPPPTYRGYSPTKRGRDAFASRRFSPPVLVSLFPPRLFRGLFFLKVVRCWKQEPDGGLRWFYGIVWPRNIFSLEDRLPLFRCPRSAMRIFTEVSSQQMVVAWLRLPYPLRQPARQVCIMDRPRAGFDLFLWCYLLVAWNR